MSYETKGIKRDAGGNPIPQYFNQAKNDYEPLQGSDGASLVKIVNPNVTVENLPQVQNVSDADVKVELERIYQQQEQILARQGQILERLNGTLDTQLMGSNVERIVVANQLSVSDTDTHWNLIDVSKFRGIEIIVVNRTDQSMKVFATFDSTQNLYRYYDDGLKEWRNISLTQGHAEIPSTGTPMRYILSSVFPILTNVPTDQINLAYKFDIPPTTGNIDVVLIGVK